MKLALANPGFNVPFGGTGTLQKAIFAFIGLALIIAVLFALFNMAMGGIDMIMSVGKKENVKRGQEKFFFSILGLILIFLSFLFINVISKALGINLLRLN